MHKQSFYAGKTKVHSLPEQTAAEGNHKNKLPNGEMKRDQQKLWVQVVILGESFKYTSFFLIFS